MLRHIPDTATITLTAAEYEATIAQECQVAAQSAIAEANDLREKLKSLQFAYDVLSNDSADLLHENKRFSAEIEQLKARIAALTPDTPPVEPTLRNVAGITITKDDTPSAKQDGMTRDLLRLCGGLGFTHWRGLVNHEEIKSTRSLPAFGRECGMQFVADTIDSQVKILDDFKLTDYFINLKKHGAVALYFNDVDDPKKADVVHDWIARARKCMNAASLNVPLIGSFTANFDRDKYPGFDGYEIQCFGTLAEFRRFMEIEADYLCIDAQKSATLEYVQKMTALVAEAGRDFWAYTAHDYDGTDWRAMPAIVEIYRAFLSQWKQKQKLPL